MNKIGNNTEQHIEGGEECEIRNVRMTPELMNQFATRTIDGYRVYWEWGEPDEEGFYSPQTIIDYNDLI